jgi:hypothetical protein
MNESHQVTSLVGFEVILCRFNFNESITYADGTLVQVAHLTRRLRERRAKAPTQAEIE